MIIKKDTLSVYGEEARIEARPMEFEARLELNSWLLKNKLLKATEI